MVKKSRVKEDMFANLINATDKKTIAEAEY